MEYETFFRVIVYGAIAYYGYLRIKNRKCTDENE